MRNWKSAKNVFLWPAFILMLLSAQIGRAEDQKPTVFVSIVPLKYFVEEIGGGLVDVQVMVQPGANADTYEPKPMQMVQLSRAAIYFAIGLPFEKAWLNKIAQSNPRMIIERLDAGLPRIAMAKGHAHAEDKGQSHDIEDDPHIWLSPPLVRQFIPGITAALIRIDPTHADLYTSRSSRLLAAIDTLHEDLQRRLQGHRGRQFMVFHPAWGYFAQAYGLEQVPIEIEGKHPKPAQLQELITLARRKGIRVIFVQPQVSMKSARVIANEIGAQVVQLDPLAEDWQANLRHAADAFSTALK